MKILKTVITIALFIVVYSLVYQTGYDEGKLVGRQYVVQHYQPFISMAYQFGRLELQYGRLKDVPWDEFTIEQKMILCAAGSPGNHFRDKDVEELLKRYGPK